MSSSRRYDTNAYEESPESTRWGSRNSNSNYNNNSNYSNQDPRNNWTEEQEHSGKWTATAEATDNSMYPNANTNSAEKRSDWNVHVGAFPGTQRTGSYSNSSSYNYDHPSTHRSSSWSNNDSWDKHDSTKDPREHRTFNDWNNNKEWVASSYTDKTYDRDYSYGNDDFDAYRTQLHPRHAYATHHYQPQLQYAQMRGIPQYNTSSWGQDQSSYGMNQQKQTKIDMYQSTTQYIIEMDLPGYAREYVDVKLNGSELLITAKPYPSKDFNYLMRERRSSQREVSRKVFIPSAVDGTKITAQLSNGVLKITVPKTNTTTASIF